jgi:PmbA protein
MSADLQNRAAQAVELAKGAGAAEAWATATQGRDVEFEYRDGALEKVKDTTSRNLSIRIYAGDRYSSHQTTDLNPERLQSFVAEAVAITRALEPDEHRQITPAELFQGRPEVDLDLVDAAVAGITREQRLAWCEELDKVATAHDRVISATAGIYDGTLNSASASSNGFAGAHAETYCWYGTNITLMDQGDKRASDGYYVGGQHVHTLPSAAGVAQTGLDRALSRLGSEKGPTTKTSIPANARRVHQGRSFWADLVGEQAFSDKLSIADDPLIPRGFGSRHFDSEGISSKYLPIVENGVVRNLYVDTYHGRKAGMTPTTGSASNRVVTPGEHSLEGLLAEVGNGVYVTSWLGGNADQTTGDFSLGLRGHMIENGEIGPPVGEMNVTGNLRDLFSQLELVGNDVYKYSSTLTPSLVFGGVDFSGA